MTRMTTIENTLPKKIEFIGGKKCSLDSLLKKFLGKFEGYFQKCKFCIRLSFFGRSKLTKKSNEHVLIPNKINIFGEGNYR